MQKILAINGHEYYPLSRGHLSATLFRAIVDSLSNNYELQTTVLEDGFDKQEEQEKVKWADALIYQTLIYNYSVPATFKKCFDVTHGYGVYFRGNPNDYGIDTGFFSCFDVKKHPDIHVSG